MAIDFTLTAEQKQLQADVRAFGEDVLAPAVREADAEPDPLRGFQRTKAPYLEAYKRGIAMCFVPKDYGGGGISNVDLILAHVHAISPSPRRWRRPSPPRPQASGTAASATSPPP